MKIGKNIYMILSKKLEYYYIETYTDIIDGKYEVHFSVDLSTTLESSDELREHISHMDTTLEVMEMVEGLDLVVADEDVEIDDELLSEISTRIELYLDDLRFWDLNKLLEEYEPKKPDFIPRLDEKRTWEIDKILMSYHTGRLTKEETMELIQKQFFGKF